MGDRGSGLLVACAASLALVGCGAEVRRMGVAREGAGRVATRSGAVALVASGDAGCDGEVLGVVHVPFVYGEEAASRRALAESASQLGADAVVDVHQVTSGTDEHLLGTAMRCGSLREARPYVVLGEIDVPEAEEGPEAALATLRARASAMEADLIVDVRLAKDDASHAHVRGTAIKYR